MAHLHHALQGEEPLLDMHPMAGSITHWIPNASLEEYKEEWRMSMRQQDDWHVGTVQQHAVGRIAHKALSIG